MEQTERHGVYIVGYTDGTFGPSRSMTRAEAAAIFARLLAEKNGDIISTAANTKFADIPAHAWYSGYVKYLSNNGITYGKTYCTQSILIRLLNLTADYYRYLKALNCLDDDDYDTTLMEPVSLPCNVSGGIGFVGIATPREVVITFPERPCRNTSSSSL